MSEYVHESGASTRARKRRRRSIITLLVVVALLFGAFWYAYSYYREPVATAKPTATCTTAKKPTKVTVNVYNATDRSGLAATTAGLLKKRGLTIGTIANDPKKKAVKATAEVRYGPKGAAAAKLVAAQVSKPTMVKDKRKDATVDFVIGDGFSALATQPTPSVGSTC